jgi:hypothetical protein
VWVTDLSSGSVLTFEAVIEEADRGGAMVRVPADVVAALGGKGRIPVHAAFDGVAYRGSVVSMGGGDKVIGVLKSIRAQIGKGPGDVIAVSLEADVTKRTVAVPDDLRVALEGAGAADAFAALSYTHQREHVAWVEEAKRADTRARRVAATVDRIAGAP